MQACWVLLWRDTKGMLVGREGNTSMHKQTHACIYVRLAVVVVSMKPAATFQELSSSDRPTHKSKNRSVETTLACSHLHTQTHTSVKYHGPPSIGELLLGSWKTDSNHHLREWKAAERVRRGGSTGIGKIPRLRSCFLQLLVTTQNESEVLVLFVLHVKKHQDVSMRMFEYIHYEPQAGMPQLFLS